MEDILAILLIFGGGTLIAISFSPIGKAVADRMRHGKLPAEAGASDPAIWEELDRLREELSQVQERLEFSERLLTQRGTGAEEA